MTPGLSPLRLARLSAGKTQFQVARTARIAASRLSILERDQDSASADERAALSRALGIPQAQLFPVPSVALGTASPSPSTLADP